MSMPTISTMTSRQRWLAALRREPVDRLPFWPKLDVSYPLSQSEPFNNMKTDAIHSWIGSDRHQGIAGCIRVIHHRTSVETTEADGRRRTVYRTPHGRMESVHQYDRPSNSWHPATYPIQCLDDIKMMTQVYEDRTVELNVEGLAQAREDKQRIGEGAISIDTIGQSPLMHWVQWLAGIENAHMLLMDHPAEVEELFGAMHRLLLRRTQLCCAHHPADALYISEDTSTLLISPQQYRRYCLRHIGEYARIAKAAGREVILHMCGHLHALLDDLETLPVSGFEAFTAPPLGNATLLDGRTRCPTKTLVGGTHAMLWLEPAEKIIAFIERRLEELPHHRGIVVTSGGQMPRGCPPQRIKTVCEWLRKYPVRC